MVAKIEGKTTWNNKPLEDLKKRFFTKEMVKIGILYESKQRDDGFANAEIGVIQEFGSITDNIPPRSFLRMPIETHVKEVMNYMAKNKEARNAFEKGDKKKLLDILGLKVLDIIQQAFESRGFGQWAPNAPSTIAQKGSDFPLVNTSQLRRAIMHKVAKL